MNILAWVALGLIAGAIGKAIYPGHQGGGLLATMLLGITGSFIGGSIFSLINTGSLSLVGASFSIPGVIVAVIGAIVAIFLWGLFTRRTV